MTPWPDRLLAAVGLLLASPALALAALGIKVVSRDGSPLYRATRAGIGGAPFTMYKLRTMHTQGRASPRISGRRDPRVFAWGSTLRRLKLDEVPQLFNVVRGEMALVGPRPEDVTIVGEHYDEFMRETLAVPPGITGLGSLDYYAHEIELPVEPSEAERRYLEHLLPWKVALDLVFVRSSTPGYRWQIVGRTLLSVLGLGWLSIRVTERERAEALRILAAREPG